MSILTPAVIELAAETTLLISQLETSQQTDALARHIEESDVFVGIDQTRRGRHHILVKGRKLLEEIVANGTPRAVRTGGIFLTCDEEAVAMRLVFGDGEDEDLPLAIQ